MQKKENVANSSFCIADLTSLLFGIVAGIAALCLVCLLFACGMLYGLLPASLLTLYAGIALSFSGFVASMVIGPRGRMLLFVPASLLLLAAAAWILGELIFGGNFWTGKAVMLLIAQLFGLALGSAVSNLR